MATSADAASAKLHSPSPLSAGMERGAVRSPSRNSCSPFSLSMVSKLLVSVVVPSYAALIPLRPCREKHHLRNSIMTGRRACRPFQQANGQHEK